MNTSKGILSPEIIIVVSDKIKNIRKNILFLVVLNLKYVNHKPAKIKKILDIYDPRIFSSPKKLETLLSMIP